MSPTLPKISARELRDLEREARRPFASQEAAHLFRIRRIQERAVEGMLRENRVRLEASRLGISPLKNRLVRTDPTTLAFEVYEALKLRGFPADDVARFRYLLSEFANEVPALASIREALPR